MIVAGKLNVIALAIVVVSALGASTASATVVLDQDFFPAQEVNSLVDCSSPEFSYGATQTFTVGQAGVLDSVEIQAFAFSLTEMRILQTSGGVPIGGAAGSIVLASSTLMSTLPDDVYRFDLSGAGLNVSVGDVLAIEPIDDLMGAGLWAGHTNANYPGGRAFTFNTSNSDWTPHLFAEDMRFRTYVNVPEPASAALVMVGGLMLASRRRR